MTVIACRDGIMAADTGAWIGDLAVHFGVIKIRRCPEGLAAASGSVPEIEAFHKWLNGEIHDKPFESEDFGAVLLTSNGVWKFDKKLRRYPHGPIATEGCHSEFLFGAMLHGASAPEAVQLAIMHCAFAAGEVQVERL